MINRRVVFKRAKRVLSHNIINDDALNIILNDVKSTLENYMKVSDMHACFDRLEDGSCILKLSLKASNFACPHNVLVE